MYKSNLINLPKKRWTEIKENVAEQIKYLKKIILIPSIEGIFHHLPTNIYLSRGSL